MLAKYLASWFRTVVDYHAPHSVLNSTQLALKLSSQKFPAGSILVSFDVSSMYSNIPVAPSIDLMLSHLVKKHVPPDVIQEFSNLIKICLAQNICFFQNSIYKFPDGLPMGAPLSSLVADILMDAQEQHFLNSDRLSPHIRFWTRYVDDVLCIWHGSLNDLQLCLNHLNMIQPTLKFTMEVGGQRINYLDLTISLEENNNILSPKFSIYRKPTFTGVSIPSSSLHSRNHEAASISAAIHRMLSIPCLLYTSPSPRDRTRSRMPSSA